MHFLIYGAGALGQALGGLLAARGHKVSLVLRPRYIDVIKNEGLSVTGIFGTFRAAPGSLELLTDLAGCDGTDFDYILITTKSYSTGQAIADIAGLSGVTCPVVSMQNGCGNLEQIAEQFGEERSLGARVITGFEILRPGVVDITVSADAVHIGSSHRGTITRDSRLLAEEISRAGLPCQPVADIFQSLFAKLLYNCALNPLGAILGVNYGALTENQDTKEIMEKVIGETFAVISARGSTLPWANARQYISLFYDSLLPATYNHRSSMLQDLENNKPTEIDALSGWVTNQGKLHGVPTPISELLTALIRFKEQQSTSYPDGETN